MIFVKRVFPAALCVAFVFVTCLSLQVLLRRSVPSAVQYPKARYNLVIDPGHGGMDVGTVAADGTAEKEINLAIARDLYAFAVISGIPASMTRTGDYLVYKAGDDQKRSDLYNRFDYINSVDNAAGFYSSKPFCRYLSVGDADLVHGERSVEQGTGCSYFSL